jgi:hypothetical protein
MIGGDWSSVVEHIDRLIGHTFRRIAYGNICRNDSKKNDLFKVIVYVYSDSVRRKPWQWKGKIYSMALGPRSHEKLRTMYHKLFRIDQVGAESIL